MKIGKRSKWLALFVIVATLVSLLLLQAGIASAATLQPSINPAGGTYTSAQTVTIYNIASGDTAYYTTDGSNPETSSTRIAYTGAFTVYQSETVEAVDYRLDDRLEQRDLGRLLPSEAPRHLRRRSSLLTAAATPPPRP